jgi:hypothetical protein
MASFYPKKIPSTVFLFSDIYKLTVQIGKQWLSWNLNNFDTKRNITRAEFSVLLDKTINPFRLVEPDVKGIIRR